MRRTRAGWALALVVAGAAWATRASAQGSPEPQTGGPQRPAAAAQRPAAHAMPPVLPHDQGPVVTAVRTTAPITVDGSLDEAVWQTAPPVTEFWQLDPDEGAHATEKTEVRFLYDDDAIYVGAWLWSDPKRMWHRFVRRDMPQTDSEIFGVHFDSYHDHRTSYRFSTNPSGSKRDLVLIGKGGGIGGLTGGDATWNPIWDVKTSIGDGIWYAEMRIPFSQLRFRPVDQQVWGILIERRLRPAEEMVSSVYIPKGEPGGVPRFGHLVGIEGIKPGRKLELLPYAGGRAELIAVPQSGSVSFVNPFRKDAELFGSGGLDMKYRVTSNITLDGTVNPDFGQVEVDPAVINLTAFETRFQEQRPFFVEGADNFEFANPGGADILYSRRIGRTPHGSAPGEAVYTLTPTATTILGAAKISGKTNGWSLGMLDAATGRETSSWMGPDAIRQQLQAEPLTNYFAGRLRREMRAGQTNVGMLFTAVNRDLSGSPLALHTSAFSGGADLHHEFDGRKWNLELLFSPSLVRGSSAALVATQRTSTRYFQRPDADYLGVDSSATSLAGYGVRASIEKQAGLWQFSALTNLVSPGYEVNDLGFQTSADRIDFETTFGYDQPRRGSVFRNWGAHVTPELGWNYGGDRIASTVEVGADGELEKSLVTFRANVGFSPERFDQRLTRGGPLARSPAGWSASFGANNETRSKLPIRVGTDWSGDESGAWQRRFNGSVSFKNPAFGELALGPTLTLSRSTAQYVTAVTDAAATRTFGRRYVFADLRQTTLSLDTRLQMAFSQAVSFDLFAQPFLSTGDYEHLKELDAPRTFRFDRYGEDVGTLSAVDAGRRFEIDPDGAGPAKAFRVDDKDFNFRSLRMNAVFRWEWRPGSTLYLVWQQMRSGTLAAVDGGQTRKLGSFDFSRDGGDLFRLHADNILLIKASYWLNP